MVEHMLHPENHDPLQIRHTWNLAPVRLVEHLAKLVKQRGLYEEYIVGRVEPMPER
jgi:hypothetical protein